MVSLKTHFLQEDVDYDNWEAFLAAYIATKDLFKHAICIIYVSYQQNCQNLHRSAFKTSKHIILTIVCNRCYSFYITHKS